MKFGGAMFFTEYSMTAPELAVALEERGYDSVWAPEHSHIPLSRKTPFPGGGELPKQYADALYTKRRYCQKFSPEPARRRPCRPWITVAATRRASKIRRGMLAASARLTPTA